MTATSDERHNELLSVTTFPFHDNSAWEGDLFFQSFVLFNGHRLGSCVWFFNRRSCERILLFTFSFVRQAMWRRLWNPVESKFFTSQSSFSCIEIFVHVAHLFFFCFCEVLHIHSASYRTIGCFFLFCSWNNWILNCEGTFWNCFSFNSLTWSWLLDLQAEWKANE